MRDPNRIPRILDLLRDYWVANPDLRLAQIIVNATGETAPVVFYAEDDVIEEALCADAPGFDGGVK